MKASDVETAGSSAAADGKRNNSVSEGVISEGVTSENTGSGGDGVDSKSDEGGDTFAGGEVNVSKAVKSENAAAIPTSETDSDKSAEVVRKSSAVEIGSAPESEDVAKEVTDEADVVEGSGPETKPSEDEKPIDEKNKQK